MSKTTQLPMPEVVDFTSESVACKAIVAYGQRSLNMRSCLINLGEDVAVQIEYLPDRTRVIINDGQVWFDTSEECAVQIEALFQTGKAPAKH